MLLTRGDENVTEVCLESTIPIPIGALLNEEGEPISLMHANESSESPFSRRYGQSVVHRNVPEVGVGTEVFEPLDSDTPSERIGEPASEPHG